MSVLRTAEFTLPYVVLWAVLLRALLIKSQIAPQSCGRCGYALERRAVGEPICRCG